jgi:hypothetical protein
MKMAEEGGNQQ